MKNPAALAGFTLAAIFAGLFLLKEPTTTQKIYNQKTKTHADSVSAAAYELMAAAPRHDYQEKTRGVHAKYGNNTSEAVRQIIEVYESRYGYGSLSPDMKDPIYALMNDPTTLNAVVFIGSRFLGEIGKFNRSNEQAKSLNDANGKPVSAWDVYRGD